MPITVTIPAEYTFVLCTLFASGLVNQFHGVLTGKWRKAGDVKYPTAYVTEAEANQDINKYRFNCAQRAHSNYLENLPQFLIFTSIGGLFFPRATATTAAVWLIGRIMYGYGYSANAEIGDNGKGRFVGMMYLIGQLGLMGMAGFGLWNATTMGL